MDLATCKQKRSAPKLSAGDTLEAGRFFHNIRSAELFFRYKTEPNFGRGVKGWRLNWSRDDAPCVSVNLCTCVRSACCSILLDKHRQDKDSVVELILPELAALLGVQLVAIYDPVSDDDGYENPCHFNIQCLDQNWAYLDTALRRLLRSPATGDTIGWPKDLSTPAFRLQASAQKALHDTAYSVISDPCTDH